MTLAVSAFGQTNACPVVNAAPLTNADKAYSAERYADAESLYATALEQHPNSIALKAALVRTLLHEGKLSEAASEMEGISPDDSHSAVTLTALAEVELQQGLPWLAVKSLDAAQSTDRCYARAHLLRSRVMGVDSMYASQRQEILQAYAIDPTDADIARAWKEIVEPANQIESIERARGEMRALDAKTRQNVEASVQSLMARLSENSQTCKVSPTAAAATLPLLPTLEDKDQHIDRYQIEAQLPQGSAKLLVDTTASGVFISRAMAELNHLRPAAGAPLATVHVDDLKIGPLEFHDCTVGVSDARFPDKADGMIGTDMFAPYLITLDFRLKELRLAPLPPQNGLLPGDRVALPEMKGYVPVYHWRQFLLIPVTVDKKERRLFVAGTGATYTTMALDVARAVSKPGRDFTYEMQTVSGAKEEFYRDHFDLRFANLPVIQHRSIVEYDLATVSKNAGVQVAGILGLDILDSLVVHLDYRDGLVRFEVANMRLTPKVSDPDSYSVNLDAMH
ncbi:MAG TPA: aspartyl protease family protein [Acidobacteriaceae bacterium]|nr:aspartyl protease family protein [Acidobacteriaceae bacterium]